MIGIINYGTGNIQAIVNSFNRIGVESKLINTSSDFKDVSRLILPGVGSFDSVMKRFSNSGLRNSLSDAVLKNNIPVMGICVGLQMLFQTSDEGKEEGLGFLAGSVKYLKSDTTHELRLPHMGWNTIYATRDSQLFSLNTDARDNRFYFLHSYFVKPTLDSIVTARAIYSHYFSVSIEYENIFGVQFHPEKSHNAGLKLLKRFALGS